MNNEKECRDCQSVNDLWECFIGLAEQFQERMNPAEFGHAIIGFCTEMLFDTEPRDHAAMLLIFDAVQNGIMAHRQPKEGESTAGQCPQKSPSDTCHMPENS